MTRDTRSNPPTLLRRPLTPLKKTPKQQQSFGNKQKDRRASVTGLVLASAVACGGPLDGAPSERCGDCDLRAPDSRSELVASIRPTGVDGTIEYQLTNVGSDSVRYLPHGTPFDEVPSNAFRVYLDDAPIRYVGPRSYRDEPLASDYRELAAGETVSTKVQLTEAYAMAEAGGYSVATRLDRILVRVGGSDLAVRVDGELTTFVDVDAEHVFVEPEPVVSKWRNWSESCTPAEWTALADAETVADQMLEDAYAYLEAGLNMTPVNKYEDWFGPVTLTRWIDVWAMIADIGRGLEDTQYECHDEGDLVYTRTNGDRVGCGTGPGLDVDINAAVGGSLGNSVHVCPSFINATDRARASVMVHEGSHIQGTDDFVVTRLGALGLAISSPDEAINSGKNYEQFVLEF